MSKSLFIAEKPSVAAEFAKTLKVNSSNKRNGYLENDNYVVTWCVGHLITMSYPEVYDEKYKKWRLDTLPFMPDKFLYEVIDNVRGQYDVVASLLRRDDIDKIYVCTDAGREGEYIYRLVDTMVGVTGKDKRRVWIDSQTEDEIKRGIREAKPLDEYNNLCDAAYLRAKEDYLMGINFSRALSLKYGSSLASYLNLKYMSISVGRVMTCVLGMIVNREREIRNFVKTPFYKIGAAFSNEKGKLNLDWKAVETSAYFNSPLLYKDNGFLKRADADAFKESLSKSETGTVKSVSKKKEKKQAPLLFNLAELQNTCSKAFKISPDETLKITQELYERKLVTYPRTDARVLSTAVGKEIYKNIKGLAGIPIYKEFVDDITAIESYKTINKTKYVNDKQVTDHYAIIPTGQGLGAINSLSPLHKKVYDAICRRFLSIFYDAAVYEKQVIEVLVDKEYFSSTNKVLITEGYYKVTGIPKSKEDDATGSDNLELKKGATLQLGEIEIKEGETTPPKRYNSGAMILAMENAGQLIEDEELRAQIKGSGIGTSATRAEILKKLVTKKYVNLNKKTQIYTPTLLGEMIYEVVDHSIRSLLNPKLTASWEKGLSYVEGGTVSEAEYMEKLKGFVGKMTNGVKGLNNANSLKVLYDKIAVYYK